MDKYLLIIHGFKIMKTQNKYSCTSMNRRYRFMHTEVVILIAVGSVFKTVAVNCIGSHISCNFFTASTQFDYHMASCTRQQHMRNLQT